MALKKPSPGRTVRLEPLALKVSAVLKVTLALLVSKDQRAVTASKGRLALLELMVRTALTV
jgi:hypothetical protein